VRGYSPVTDRDAPTVSGHVLSDSIVPRARGGSLHLGEALRVQGFSDGDLSAIAD
jgi:hypothetical protein